MGRCRSCGRRKCRPQPKPRPNHGAWDGEMPQPKLDTLHSVGVIDAVVLGVVVVVRCSLFVFFSVLCVVCCVLCAVCWLFVLLVHLLVVFWLFVCVFICLFVCLFICLFGWLVGWLFDGMFLFLLLLDFST